MWGDHSGIQLRRQLLRLALSLTERHGCQLVPGSDCEKVTEHTDRDSHNQILKLFLNELHCASPLSVQSPKLLG